MTDKLTEIRARLKAFGSDYTFVARHCDEPDNDKDITRDVEDLLAYIDQHCQQPATAERERIVKLVEQLRDAWPAEWHKAAANEILANIQKGE